MKTLNKTVFILLVITALVLSILFYKLTLINKSNNLINNLENAMTTTRYLFEEQKRYALSLSIILAQDKELIDSFKQKNREKSFEVVNRKIKLLKKLQNSQIDVQIHNKDLSTYLRSWNLSIKDVPLQSFRHGIVKAHKDKKPIVSIELGKRLNIKAISPLLENNEIIGSIEVIIGFEYLEQELKKEGLDTYILLNNKFLNIADTLKRNTKIGQYTLVNDKNKEIEPLEGEVLNQLNDYGYFTNENKAFSYFSIYSFKREKLGYIIISLANNDAIKINKSYEKNKLIKSEGVLIE